MMTDAPAAPSPRIALSRPCSLDGRTVADIGRPRRATVADLIEAWRQPGPTAREAKLLSLCGGGGFELVCALHPADLASAVRLTGCRFVGGARVLDADSPPDAEERERGRLRLRHPVTGPQGPVEWIDRPRPATVGDLIHAERQEGTIAQDAMLLSRCAAVPYETVLRLDCSDFHRAVQGGLDGGFLALDDVPDSGGPSPRSPSEPDGDSASS